jgi:membrane protein
MEARSRNGWFASLRQAFSVWRDADGPRLGAAIAFYSTLSLAPFLLIVVGVAGVFLGDADVRAHLVAQVDDVVGASAASFVDQVLEHGATARGRGWVAAIGVVTLLFGATATFSELRAALANIFDEPADLPLLDVVRTRAVALALAVGAGLLLSVTLVATTIVSATIGALARDSSTVLITMATSELLTFVVVTVVFTALTALLPARRVPWRAAAIGGSAGAGLFAVGKYALSAYIGHVATESAFGASASMVVVMLWVYYSAQMFLLGAALARVKADQQRFLWTTDQNEDRIVAEGQ